METNIQYQFEKPYSHSFNNTEQTNTNKLSNSSCLNLERLLFPLSNNTSIDPINQIWTDKLKIARSKISSLLQALTQRDKIKQSNIYGINENICKIHTQQFALGDNSPMGKYSINLDKLGLEKSVINLEKEKRGEELSCWKDKLMMRKDLIEAVNEYLALKRKMDLLGIKILNKHYD